MCAAYVFDGTANCRPRKLQIKFTKQIDFLDSPSSAIRSTHTHTHNRDACASVYWFSTSICCVLYIYIAMCVSIMNRLYGYFHILPQFSLWPAIRWRARVRLSIEVTWAARLCLILMIGTRAHLAKITELHTQHDSQMRTFSEIVAIQSTNVTNAFPIRRRVRRRLPPDRRNLSSLGPDVFGNYFPLATKKKTPNLFSFKKTKPNRNQQWN